MAINAYPINDKEYVAEDAQTFHCTRTNGVYSDDNHYRVTPAGGMLITVGTGIAWMRLDEFGGAVYPNREAETLTIETSNAYYPRVDRVVIRQDYIINDSYLAIVSGTAASNPIGANLTRNTYEAYEMCVAEITVPAGATEITAANIKDTRLDENLCGIMRDAVTRIPTHQLLDSWWAWFRETQTEGNLALSEFKAWIEYWQKQINDDFIEWYATWKSEITQVVYSWYNDLRRESEAEIQRLIDDLRGMLDDNIGTALYENLDKHKRTGAEINPNGVHNRRMRYDKYQIRLPGLGWHTIFTVTRGLSCEYIKDMRKSATWWAAQQYTAHGVTQLIETESERGLSAGYIAMQNETAQDWAEKSLTCEEITLLQEEEWIWQA